MKAAALTTYNERLESVVRRVPERVAVRLKVQGGYREVTYAGLHHQITGVARALVLLGLPPQARAAILSENRPEWVIAYLGIYLARGSVVPIDPQITAAEWRRLLDDSDARIVFVSGTLLPKLKQALQDSPLAGKIVCFDPPGAEDALLGSLADLVESGHSAGASLCLPGSALSDVAVIIYTSGTTGKPKGVMLTQQNIVSTIAAALQAIPLADESNVFLCLLPLHHVFASVVSFLLPLYLGAQIVFADTLKRTEILAALQEANISILATVPQFFYLFHGRIEEELGHKGKLARRLFRVLMRFNRICIRLLHLNLGKLLFPKIHRTFGAHMRFFVSGGSAFDPKVAQDFYDLGFTILQGYGLTETTGPCAVTRVENNIVGSVGSALAGVEIMIQEPGGDGIGEVAVRGPIVMAGYYRNPEGTAQVMRDGWFLSGDLGRLDAEGNLYITGRKKEVIVLPNGKNIYPDEIEAHYEQCPYIKEIAVLGVAEASHAGAERVHAVVVPDFDALKARKIANAREVIRDEIARLSNRLPQYKRLMSYQIQKQELPRTTTRKIKRLELKRMIENGELRDVEAAAPQAEISRADRDLLDSPAGQEVLSCLRQNYHRDIPIHLGMNIELDLGFDSMERVELLASLEQSLGLELPEGFGAEIYTVRDLILGLQQQVGGTTGGGMLRQSWAQILSPESLEEEQDCTTRFSGTIAAHFRCVVLKLFYWLSKILFRLEASGCDRLPPEGPYLICPNHVSYLDALVVLAPLPYRVLRRVFFVGASDFFATPLMKLLARVANIFPVDPDAHLLQAMKIGACGLRSGRILCIFPEGARSFDGRPGLFKKGAAILAREIGVPIVPVAILGAFQAWPRDSRRIRFHKIKVIFGEPLKAGPGAAPAAYQADTDRLRQAVSELLGVQQ